MRLLLQIIIPLSMCLCACSIRQVQKLVDSEVLQGSQLLSIEDSTVWQRTHLLTNDNPADWINTNLHYASALSELDKMLKGERKTSFKEAVFTTENAYFNNEIESSVYNEIIDDLVGIIEAWMKTNVLTDYPYSDSLHFAKNGAIFKFMTDTVFYLEGTPLHLPFEYDFDDFFGNQDWTKMFVSKLIATGEGNCHSMPYLYKILAEELGTKAYLSYAPNHVYIKQRCKMAGWYNTELTSKVFPVDAWVMTSGYVSKETIMSEIYMDTLSDKQSLAACVIDLAHGYKHKQRIDYQNFVLQCTELALEYYPNYAAALLLKAETLKEIFEIKRNEMGVEYPSEIFHLEEPKAWFEEMEKTYGELVKLGYREVPKDTYLQWLSELANNIDKYENKKITNFSK